MVSQTRAPRVVTDIGIVPWVNLQNISATDGSFAYSVNTSGGMCVVFLTTDGVNPNTGGCTYGPSGCNAHYIDIPGGYYPNPTGGLIDRWNLFLSPDVINSPNFGIIVWTPGGSFLAKDFGFNVSGYAAGILVSVVYNEYQAFEGTEPWANCGYFACNQHQISGVYVTVNPFAPAILTISSMTISPTNITPGTTVTFSATVTNSESSSSWGTVYGYLNGVKVASGDFEIAQYGTTPVSFTYTIPAGYSAGTISACCDLV